MYNEEKFKTGSIWRKWDLHVHTPASFYWKGTKRFSQMNADEVKSTTEAIIKKINESDVKVFSFQDYWTFDGYLTIKENIEKHSIQLNKTILPGMELRVEAPVDYRLNIHVIFSENTTTQELKDFKSTLKIGGLKKITLSDDGISSFASGLDAAKASAHGFNGEYKENPEQLYQLGSKTAEVTRESLQEAITNIGEDKCIVILPYDCSDGIIKLDWKKHSGADEYFLQMAKIFETRSEDNIKLFHGTTTEQNKDYIKDFINAIGGKPKPVISGSDAHRLEDYGKSPGDLFTWIKADPTFQGLKQTIVEPNRSFVGLVPPKLEQIKSNRTKFISTLLVTKDPTATSKETWFDNEIDLNPELVAIIGNKGMGKSALADIIGLLANSRQHEHFSFLSDSKFKNKKNYKADKFIGKVTWASGSTESKRLDATLDENSVELVKYIPQSYLEKICNDADIIQSQLFESELEDVIFSHINEKDRLGLSQLKELVEYKTEESEQRINGLRDNLKSTLKKIISLEDKCTEDYQKSITNKLTEVNNQIQALDEARPNEINKPDEFKDDAEKKSIEETNTKIENLSDQIKIFDGKIKENTDKLSVLAKEIANIEKIENQIKLTEQTFETQMNKVAVLLEGFELKIDDIISFNINNEPITQLRLKIETTQQEITDSLSDDLPDSLVFKREKLKEQKSALEKKLNEPNKKYQEFLKALETWKKKRELLVGTKDKVNTQQYFNNILSEISKYPNQIIELEKEKDEHIKKIHIAVKDLSKLYKQLYAPVQKFVEEYNFDKEGFNVNFTVSISENRFSKDFFEIVARNSRGSFYGKNESEKELAKILSPIEFENTEEVIKFCNIITDRLKRDYRSDDLTPVSVKKQVREGKTVEDLYSFIYSLSYLRPKYELKLNNKTIQELSPGERGTLLLIFYLLVDKDNRPLIIDQPEENLDNQTIYSVLVPAIKESKVKRQIIMVTHNPNLAVVCDAEQIIVAHIDKRNGNKVLYESGSIEDSKINEEIVNVLEGTKPAFNNREAKYLDLS